MARPRALADHDIFALAEQLRAAGQLPSVTKVAEQAKAQFGVTPSYTTLKQVLTQWRHLEAANAPKELPAEFLNEVLGTLTALYGRMVAQVRSEFEQYREQADRQREEAELERDRLEVERTRLVDEVAHLRDTWLEAQRTQQRQSAEFAAVVAVRDQLASELRQVRDEYRVERNEHRARIQTLEAQINSLIEGRSALDRRYESLLDVMKKQQREPPSR